MANIDDYPDWRYCHATKKDSPIIKGMTREIVNHFSEIRSIALKPGKRAEFHGLHIEEVLPVLPRWNFDLLAYCP
jgi:hypothetical protein